MELDKISPARLAGRNSIVMTTTSKPKTKTLDVSQSHHKSVWSSRNSQDCHSA